MRVCIVPEYPMALMSGGLQVQALETFRALSALKDGLTVELFDWSITGEPADLYHFVGFPPHLFRVAELVRQAGRRYVITLLLGSPGHSSQLMVSALKQRINSQLLRERARYAAVMGASAVVTITEPDVKAAKTIYGISQEKIAVIPNGVASSFFQPSSASWHGAYGTAPFVLCVGAIQRRKNQLLLVKACNRLRLPAVLLGPVLAGEDAYGRRIAEAMKENASFGGKWLQGLRNEDPLLPSAYGACRLFALLSSDETQPLSVMQAMAARKPVLLLKAPYSSDHLFCRLPAASSENLDIITANLKAAWESGMPTQLPADYTWNSVALRLHQIYQRVLENQ